MQMASKPKSREGVEDRISQMPDDVLCHILSLLDTFEAVQTTLLSKRWNNLWTSLPNLKLHFGCFPVSYFRPDRVMTFFDRVVSLHDSTDIQKFSFRMKLFFRNTSILAEHFRRIHSWICSVIERNVVELDLSIRLYGFDEMPFLLPHCLFVCKTLVVLKVDSCCVTCSNSPTTGCFPSLKVLCVSVMYAKDASIEKLFTCCPVLEELTLKGILGSEVLNINISSPELKTLRIDLNFDHAHLPAYNFFINAPKLENFDVSDPRFYSNYLLENGKSVVNAKISLYHNFVDPDSPLGCFADRTIALLANISHVICLYLEVDDLNVSYLPHFVNLSRLVLVRRHCFRYLKYLIEFLKCCPNLKHLVLEHKFNPLNEWYGENEEPEWKFFDSPKVPVCLSNLRTISIKGFKGVRGDMELTEYLLKNGEVLNTMTIYTKALYTKEELYKKLLMYDKGSKSCLIKLN